jgi:hypothetical protein
MEQRDPKIMHNNTFQTNYNPKIWTLAKRYKNRIYAMHVNSPRSTE